MNNDIYDFSNIGIYKLIEQMQQISRPVVDTVNSMAFKTSMQSVIQQCSIHNEIMQTYFRNNTIENVIKPTLELYAQQMKKIYDIIPIIATQNLYSTMASYRNILREINFDNLKLNDNGTLEYEGESFSENEIEVTSNEIVTEINTKGTVEVGNILKKILLCLIGTLIISFLQAEDLKYFFLMMYGGFLSQPGADAYNFFKDKFIKVFKKDSITNDYFENYSGLVQIDNLKLRKKPNKDSKVIANLDFGSSIEIKNQLGSWLEINYCINEDNNTYISGWVYANGIKRINKIKQKLIS